MCSYWLLGTGDDAAYANSRYSMVFHYLIIRQKPVRSMNNEWASKRALTAATGTDVVIQSLWKRRRRTDFFFNAFLIFPTKIQNIILFIL